MSQWSVFGVDITPKFTDDNKNVLKVTSKKEIFFDVYECMYNDKNIIVEKVGTSDGLPIVSFEAIKNNKKYKCEALLVESGESELFLNENHLQFLKSIQKTPVKTIIEEKVKKVIPSNTIYEDKVRDVSEKIIKESQEKAQKLYDNKLEEYKKQKQLIAKQAEEYLNEKSESIRQELYEQYIDFLSSNDKKVNNLIKSNIDDITLSIDENNKEILSKVDKLSNLNKEELAKILSENIVNINNNLDNKIKDLNDQLDITLHDSNRKIDKLQEKTNNLIQSKTESIEEKINFKVKKINDKVEDYKVDTLTAVVGKISDNKTEIETSLKNTISEINEQVDIKRDEVEKILADELSNINEKLNIFSDEEDKKYKQLLENLNNLNKGEVKEILSEKINDKQLNSLKLDISKQFQNEMMSIKRLIEMSSGGGSVAKQFANGGTMNGSLSVAALSAFGKIIGGTETNTASGDHATVLGGVRNTASGSRSFIGNGQDNTASGSSSFVGAGFRNTASMTSSVVGGFRNTASGDSSFIGSGQDNTASGGSSFIGSGQNNIASGNRSGILGGSNNTVSHADSFIVGSGLTSNAENTTFVNNLNVTEELSVEGYSEFNKRVDINTNHGGNGLRIKSNLPSNPSSNLVVEGPATIGHDLFKQSGFSGGFASGSNHFHNLTVIDRINNSDDDALNILRVQEKYYAIPDNFLRNNKAAFWAWHKVARTVNIWNTVNLSAATLDVSALQNSSNRSSETQVPFITNTTPLKKSEPVVVTLAGHGISLGQNVRMSFSTSFEGPIVAAALFGKVSAVTTDTFSIELYGGNYKTTQEVPLGTDQSALSPGSVSLSTVAAENAVNPNNQVSLSHYSKTNFSPARLTDETLKATWDTPHNLIQNEHIVFITDGRGDLEIFKDGWVLDPDPDGDGLSAIIIYGNRLSQADLTSFAPFDGTGWTLYKGSFDGIHNETIGDILLNFDSDNVGNYKAFQIGPGCQTDSDCIAIGKNVYNKDASTVKIGYDNETLNIKSDGIDVDGYVQADNIYGSVYPIWSEEAADITDDGLEWSFGNGDETPAKQGIPIAFKSKLLKVSLNVEISSGNTTTEDIEVEVYKNGVATGAKGVITHPLSSSSSKKSQVEVVSNLNIIFDENDVINFRTVKDGNVALTSARVCAWLQTML